jgi:hypothetical protein
MGLGRDFQRESLRKPEYREEFCELYPLAEQRVSLIGFCVFGLLVLSPRAILRWVDRQNIGDCASSALPVMGVCLLIWVGILSGEKVFDSFPLAALVFWGLLCFLCLISAYPLLRWFYAIFDAIMQLPKLVYSLAACWFVEDVDLETVFSHLWDDDDDRLWDDDDDRDPARKYFLDSIH